MSKVESFKPIIDTASRVLVLGSMPGVQSLREQRYYANPNNQFWRIVYSLFTMPFDPDYDSRVRFILSKGIALWDVIETCYREGSSDSNIKNEKVNDFPSLFADYHNLALVVFNGTKAFETYMKQVGFELARIEYQHLPSTSPAYTIKFEEKLKQWEMILDYL